MEYSKRYTQKRRGERRELLACFPNFKACSPEFFFGSSPTRHLTDASTTGEQYGETICGVEFSVGKWDVFPSSRLFEWKNNRCALCDAELHKREKKQLNQDKEQQKGL